MSDRCRFLRLCLIQTCHSFSFQPMFTLDSMCRGVIWLIEEMCVKLSSFVFRFVISRCLCRILWASNRLRYTQREREEKVVCFCLCLEKPESGICLLKRTIIALCFPANKRDKQACQPLLHITGHQVAFTVGGENYAGFFFSFKGFYA